MEDAPRNNLSLRRLLAGCWLVAATFPGLRVYADDASGRDPSDAPWLRPIENLDPVFATADIPTAVITAPVQSPPFDALVFPPEYHTPAWKPVQPVRTPEIVAGETRNVERVRMFHAIREPAQRSVAIRKTQPDRSLSTAARVRADEEPTVAANQEPAPAPPLPQPRTAPPMPAVSVEIHGIAGQAQTPQPTAPLPNPKPDVNDLPPSLLHAPVHSTPAAAVTWEEMAAQTRWQRRQTIAQQVSTEILGDRSEITKLAPQLNVSTFTAQRLAQDAARTLRDAREQARRATPLSALSSAMETLRLIADANDLLDGSVVSATNLQQAQTALRESADFAGRFGPVGPDTISRMVQSHQTPVLKNCDLGTFNGSRAADVYLDFAREKLAAVALANPLATEALVVLADVKQQADAQGPVTDAIVISLLRAALQARPDDAAVANELGYQLLKQGLLSESQWVLEHSLKLQPSRAAGTNLAEVLRQRGDLVGARGLIARLDTLPVPAPQQPQVYSVSPRQFAALSPSLASPVTPAQLQSQGTPPNNTPNAATTGNSTSPTMAPAPTLASPVQPAEPKGPIGRVADAVSSLWK